MNAIKKLLAAAAAAVSAGVLSMTSIAVYADETTVSTEPAVTTSSDETSIETTIETTDTSDVSDTETTTTLPTSFNVWISFNGGGNEQEDNAVNFSANGTYTVKYTFDDADASSDISSIVLESDISSAIVTNLNMTVTSIKAGADETSAVSYSFDNTADDAFTSDADTKMYLLNIINTDEDIDDLDVSSDFKAVSGETLYVTFEVEGLSKTADTTTTTATKTISYSVNATTAASTSTVSKTADEGVVAIVVSAIAAAALAAGAVTAKRRKK